MRCWASIAICLVCLAPFHWGTALAQPAAESGEAKATGKAHKRKAKRGDTAPRGRQPQRVARGKSSAGQSGAAPASPGTSAASSTGQAGVTPSAASAPGSAGAAKAAAPPPPPSMAAGEAAGEVRQEGGQEVKALEFTGLDIEGQLKRPQMLYFLKRLRAEFDRPRLPHRSFMPELDRSTHEREF